MEKRGESMDASTLTCFVDLHLHLDGSLPLSCVRELARRARVELPAEEAALKALLTVSPTCRDLNEYLEKFDLPLRLLQTEENLTFATEALRRKLAADGVQYAEIRFAPQLHTREGLSQRQAAEAVLRGLRSPGTAARVILCCMRGSDTHAANLETVNVAAALAENGVCAVDLAGAEALYPTAEFAAEFAAASAAYVPFTIHAGEAAGAESIRAALAFGASRIGHGVRATEDAALLAELAAKKIPLELCPTSNLNTALFSDLTEYPLKALTEAGVAFTVNTDNLTVSDTTLRQEYARLLSAGVLTEAQLKSVLMTAVSAVFADEKTKAALAATIDAQLPD